MVNDGVHSNDLDPLQHHLHKVYWLEDSAASYLCEHFSNALSAFHSPVEKKRRNGHYVTAW